MSSLRPVQLADILGYVNQLSQRMPLIPLTPTSVQRISTKGRIAPELVTPVAGESILKPRIGCDALSPVDKSAAPCRCDVFCLHSLMHFDGRTTPKLSLFLAGIRAAT